MSELEGAADTADDLPDLQTRVGLAGTMHQAEVGGSVCFHSLITIAIISDGGG